MTSPSDVAAIAGATHTLRVLVDGTLSISIMIEPRHAQDAFRLFGAPGTAVALAALRPGHQEPEKPKGGPISNLAGMWCESKSFQAWLGVDTEEEARIHVIEVCGVESRAELDHNATAAQVFHDQIRKPYMQYQQEHT